MFGLVDPLQADLSSNMQLWIAPGAIGTAIHGSSQAGATGIQDYSLYAHHLFNTITGGLGLAAHDEPRGFQSAGRWLVNERSVTKPDGLYLSKPGRSFLATGFLYTPAALADSPTIFGHTGSYGELNGAERYKGGALQALTATNDIRYITSLTSPDVQNRTVSTSFGLAAGFHPFALGVDSIRRTIDWYLYGAFDSSIDADTPSDQLLPQTNYSFCVGGNGVSVANWATGPSSGTSSWSSTLNNFQMYVTDNTSGLPSGIGDMIEYLHRNQGHSLLNSDWDDWAVAA